MFGIVITVAVQSVFHIKCIKMMSFHIFKIIFDINASKQFKNTKKILILSKKKISKFLERRFQTGPKSSKFSVFFKKIIDCEFI